MNSRKMRNDIQMNMAIVQDLYRMADLYEKGKHKEEIEKTFETFASRLEGK